MTYSILSRDIKTGTLGGVATTGSYCVGGWVLRGDINIGLSASQGKSASTILGDQMLQKMKTGNSPDDIIHSIYEEDQGLEFRQISMLSKTGETAIYSGKKNEEIIDHYNQSNFVVSGNMLGSDKVIPSIKDVYLSADDNMNLAIILLECLKQGALAGGDKRGLLSAAMLILHPDQPPINLRIDNHHDPIFELEKLYHKVMDGDYYNWTKTVPTSNDPYKYK